MIFGKKNGDRKILKTDQKGQILIEALLLAIVSLGLLTAGLKYFRDTKTLDKVVNKTWSGVAQMGEYGNWPIGNTVAIHPNSGLRVRTLDPTK